MEPCLENIESGASLQYCFWPKVHEQALKCEQKVLVGFVLRSGNSNDGPVVLIGHSFLEEVYCSQLLEIFLGRGLTWNYNIDHDCLKLSSGIYVLRSFARYWPIQGARANYQFFRAFKSQEQAIRIIAPLRFKETWKELLTLRSLHFGDNLILYV
ncbi:hypothetical protein J6590_005615 [Homalodisca vitripennis]|nr:hypothetical protein J6590_005615 [Homalodisca vitripennis]